MTRTPHVTIELPGHGEFSTHLATAVALELRSKRSLARQIAENYAGLSRDRSEDSEKVSYWLGKSKLILAVVLGGMIDPLN